MFAGGRLTAKGEHVNVQLDSQRSFLQERKQIISSTISLPSCLKMTVSPKGSSYGGVPRGQNLWVPRGIPTAGTWELYKAPISIESDPELTSSVSLREERYTSINQKTGKTCLCSCPFLGWYCSSNLKAGSSHCFLCQVSRCRGKLCSGTLFSPLPFASMIFFFLVMIEMQRRWSLSMGD